MKPDPQKAEELFDRALQFELPERGAFVAGACGNDVNLRRRVEDLLMAHEAQTGFLSANQATEALEDSKLNETPGTQVSRYKLLEKLGEGGFGAVWAAEQKEPVRRRVALKIIKLGMDTNQVVARFEAERQALALMDHPNIALPCQNALVLCPSNLANRDISADIPLSSRGQVLLSVAGQLLARDAGLNAAFTKEAEQAVAAWRENSA